MVGAGTLITPLLGLPFEVGVLIVGFVVILIVATAGMASTTWVQFIKGGLLVIFSLVLVIMLLVRGFSTTPDQNGTPFHKLVSLKVTNSNAGSIALADPSYTVVHEFTVGEGAKAKTFVKTTKDNIVSFWKLEAAKGILTETQTITKQASGPDLYNGAPKADGLFFQVGNLSEIDGQTDIETGPVNPLSFFEKIKEGTVVRWGSQKLTDGDNKVTVYYQIPTSGATVLIPGEKFKIDPAKGATTADRINFISLMISLFLGTAALPHILIRYYTVRSPAFARKSTIVAVAAIGLFYLLTLYMGMGAMTHGVIDITNENMSAPLLARSFGIGIFAVISAIAFATILGTVSGLIVAASGAVANDLIHKFMRIKLSDSKMVFAGRITAIVVGVIAMALGVAFKHMNVSFLVGWAFTIAASANLPAIIMILFWKKTTAKGVIASISVGLLASLIMIILSPDTFTQVFNRSAADAPMPISQPAIISIPLSFLTLVIVSLLTKKNNNNNTNNDKVLETR
jgi:cation/acetate symporter